MNMRIASRQLQYLLALCLLVMGAFLFMAPNALADEHDYELDDFWINHYVDDDDDHCEGDVYYGDKSLTVRAYDGVSWGHKLSNVAVKVKMKGKTYSGKTGRDGKATIRIPIVKVGTKITVSCSYRGQKRAETTYVVGAQKKYSYFYEDEELDNREHFASNVLIKPTYKSSTKTLVKVRQLTKGDTIKLKIGKRTYKKKVKKSAPKATLSFKHGYFSAGASITVTQYNKYGQKMGTAKSRVFEGKKLKLWMTKKQVRNLYRYGRPDSTASGRWTYDYGGWDYIVIYFRGGRVYSTYKSGSCTSM